MEIGNDCLVTLQRVPSNGSNPLEEKLLLHKFTPKTAKENALDEQLKASTFSTSSDTSNARGCYYTSIPHVIKHKGIDVQQLTSLNLDKTQLLESVLQKEYNGSEDMLLGELQFAFIAFLMGQSLEAFLQWKSLVNLLFGCTEAWAAKSRKSYTQEQLDEVRIEVADYLQTLL